MSCSVNGTIGRALWLPYAAGCLALIGQGCGGTVLPWGNLPRAGTNRGGDEPACSPPLAAALTTDRYQLYGSDTPEGQATLRAVPLGGEPPYLYFWYVLDPAGDEADYLLDELESDSPRFTAGEFRGPHDVFCTITDSRGCSYTDKLVLTVGTPVGLDLTTERHAVAVGGGEHGRTTLGLTPLGGPPPYRVDWTVTGPDGKVDNDRLDVSDPLAPQFTSGSRVGTYTITGTIEDAAGASSVESVIVVVGQHLGLDVISSRAMVMPGGGGAGIAALVATPIGGKEPYSYEWEVVGPDGGSADEHLDDTTLRLPHFESADVSGHFLARCTVTDADGNVMLGSTVIVVGQQLTVDLTADRLILPPNGGSGNQASLSADILGGAAPLSITWSVTTPDGETDDAFLDAGGDLPGADAFEVTFSSTDEVGTFIVRCTVVDVDGVSASDSVRLIVRSHLSLDVTAASVFVAPLSAGNTIMVTATPLGGEGPYDYVWSTTGGSLVDATEQTDLAEESTTRWWAAPVATYTISCTVTDSAGQSFKDSVSIVVSFAQPLGLDVTADQDVVYAGETVNLIADQTGGLGSFSYTWSILNESGVTAGTLGAVTQSAVLDDTTNTWTAPTGTGAEGTYRIRCTVTDSLGITATSTVLVHVLTLSVQNVFLAPAATDTTSVLAAIPIDADANTPTPDPGYRILPAAGLMNPTYPRNVVITIDDGDNSVIGGTARVIGLDARGQAQSEIIPIACSCGFLGSVNTGSAPFATITEVDLFDFNVVNPATDNVLIGVGDKFGLTGVLGAASDVLYVKEGSTVRSTGYTVDMTSGQQGITFFDAPNAARDYTVVFHPR